MEVELRLDSLLLCGLAQFCDGLGDADDINARRSHAVADGHRVTDGTKAIGGLRNLRDCVHAVVSAPVRQLHCTDDHHGDKQCEHQAGAERPADFGERALHL